MSTSETLSPSIMPPASDRPKRSRFAGERLGAWLFAASFSIGMWGLALKILAPGHAVVPPAPQRHAVLAPSDAADGRATVVWESYADAFSAGYPVTDGVPVIPLAASDDPGQPRD
jgi:hypothetical protein